MASNKILRIVFNGGDSMLGRAVQLSFPVQAPGEESITDSCPASHYLNMCLHPSGHTDGDPSIDEIRGLNAKGDYLWKDYRQIPITNPPPDLRILNLETHIAQTIDNPDVPRWKGIRYHTHVDNLDAMIRPYAETTHGGATASPVVLSLANNHVLDYGRTALEQETLPALDRFKARIPSVHTVGCGRHWNEAAQPAVVAGANRAVQIWAVASGCSGTPESWWAQSNRSGVVGIPGLYDRKSVDKAVEITRQAIIHPNKNGLKILSVHMGPNWALKDETEQEIAGRREYAHRVMDECGIDILYGHSSHHVRGMELYKGKLILYGTGDMINDYEGFENRGEERYNRLGGLYIVDVQAETGKLVQLQIVPMGMNRLRLERYRKGCQLWKPRQGRLVTDNNGSLEMATFINKLSILEGKESALTVQHVREEDSSIPGGPVLVAKM